MKYPQQEKKNKIKEDYLIEMRSMAADYVEAGTWPEFAVKADLKEENSYGLKKYFWLYYVMKNRFGFLSTDPSIAYTVLMVLFSLLFFTSSLVISAVVKHIANVSIMPYAWLANFAVLMPIIASGAYITEKLEELHKNIVIKILDNGGSI